MFFSILSKYIDDFVKKNQELFSFQVKIFTALCRFGQIQLL